MVERFFLKTTKSLFTFAWYKMCKKGNNFIIFVGTCVPKCFLNENSAVILTWDIPGCTHEDLPVKTFVYYQQSMAVDMDFFFL